MLSKVGGVCSARSVVGCVLSKVSGGVCSARSVVCSARSVGVLSKVNGGAQQGQWGVQQGQWCAHQGQVLGTLIALRGVVRIRWSIRPLRYSAWSVRLLPYTARSGARKCCIIQQGQVVGKVTVRCSVRQMYYLARPGAQYDRYITLQGRVTCSVIYLHYLARSGAH